MDLSSLCSFVSRTIVLNDGHGYRCPASFRRTQASEVHHNLHMKYTGNVSDGGGATAGLQSAPGKAKGAVDTVRGNWIDTGGRRQRRVYQWHPGLAPRNFWGGNLRGSLTRK